MEGPGTQSAEDLFVTGFRDSRALGSQACSWEREPRGREWRGLVSGDPPVPLPLWRVASGGEAGQTE